LELSYDVLPWIVEKKTHPFHSEIKPLINTMDDNYNQYVTNNGSDNASLASTIVAPKYDI
jgi:hypothetical protein